MADLRNRKKHYELPTQQKRLRHLRSIAARNVNLTGHGSAEVADMEIFFTLHQTETSKAFYTSEKIKGSMNPTWRSFSLEHMILDGVNTASKTFVLKIWRGKDKKYKLCMLWEVDLTGLKYAGEKILGQSVQYPSNAVIFGMFEGYYVAPAEEQPNSKEASPSSYDTASVSSASVDHSTSAAVPIPMLFPNDDVYSVLEVDQSSVRESYSVATLLRIQTVLRAIKQTQSSVNKVRAAIEEKLYMSQRMQKKKSAREMLLLKTKMCREELAWRTRKLQQENDAYESLQAKNCQKDIALKTNFETLHKDKVRLHEKKKSYFDVREELIKTGAQLVMRRKQLISELAFIYPIQELPNHVYSVAGVRLPNSEDFAGENDTMIEVALGYTCHLVQMISHFLDVPARYPMDHRCSRSQIRDHIMDKLTDKDRDFPLYMKGKERFQFNYGVYLLNKNIAQLRYYCGLGTTDLRLTLPNLKSLLELRLGVKFESSSGPMNALANQHLSVPPNLGGPQRLTSPSFSHTSTTATKQQSLTQHNATTTQQGPLTMDNAQVESLETSGSVNGTNAIKGKENEGINRDIILSKVVDIGDKKDLQVIDAYGSPRTTNVTLEQISKEKLLGSVAIFDDLEASSSEDSANVTYGSKFKMWPKVEQHADNDVKNLVEGKNNTASFKMWTKSKNQQDNRDSETQIIMSQQIDSLESPTSTFKTKAMFHNKDTSKANLVPKSGKAVVGILEKQLEAESSSNSSSLNTNICDTKDRKKYPSVSEENVHSGVSWVNDEADDNED